MGVFGQLGDILLQAYAALIGILPPMLQKFISFFLIALLIVVYAWFIWKFYKSIAKKNLIGLNLNKYNRSKHPVMTKIVAGGLYLLEYILILPFLIFIWFTFFTLFLILLTDNLEIGTLLILSGTTIAAIRMISYHSEELSKDVAKLVPFTLLATSLLNPNFFSVERVLGHIQEIPLAFGDILTYLFFIILLELVLRAFDFVLSLFAIGTEVNLKKKEAEEEKEEDKSVEEEEAVKKELAKPAKIKNKK